MRACICVFEPPIERAYARFAACAGAENCEPVAVISDDSSSSDDEKLTVPDGCDPRSVGTRGALSVVLWDCLSRPQGLSVSRLARMASRLAEFAIPRAEVEVALAEPRFSTFYPRLANGGVASKLWAARRLPEQRGATALPEASPRLKGASAYADVLPSRVHVARGEGKFAPSGGELVLVPQDAPARFSHRRRDRRPDGECLASLFPKVNAPLVTDEIPPPPRQPELIAFSLSEVIKAKPMRALGTFLKRLDRSFELAERGNYHAAMRARPDDLRINWDQSTRAAFRGVPMDFTQWPYRSLQPSSWPDSPPSTDLKIRLIRREFRAYPRFTDRALKGVLSNGVPDFSSCTMETYLAAPHGRAYRHFQEWKAICSAEVKKGWARTHFRERISTWPTRGQPTSMVSRFGDGNFRRTDDMSWPRFGLDSPNSTADVPFAAMVQLWMLCSACAFMCVAAVPLKLVVVDLKSAYKRTGEQRSKLWQRAIMVPSGAQTNDRTCFGQSDGPSSFGRQSGFMAFVMKRELRFAAESYPTRCPSLLAWLASRMKVLGVEDEDSPVFIFVFIMVFIDDFAAVCFDDKLWRADGTPVMDVHGEQRGRASLVLDVVLSVVRRFGHDSTADKLVRPTDRALILGGTIDLVSETLSIDARKRERYLRALQGVRSRRGCPFSQLRSLVFKLLVVCECLPEGRQQLHPLFAFLRSWAERVAGESRGCPSIPPSVDAALGWFEEQLAGDVPLSVPLACREIFPPVSDPSLLIIFHDAAGSEASWAGGASCAVYEPTSELVYYVERWQPLELEQYHIGVLEAVVLFWGDMVIPDYVGNITHVLDYTDNTGAEWAARRETPQQVQYQRVMSERQSELLARGLYARAERVPSVQNRWADMLSRGLEAEVLAEARARGLKPRRVTVPPVWRELSWLAPRL